MTTLSPQDLELAKKHCCELNYLEFQEIAFSEEQLAAFLAERDAQHGEADKKFRDLVALIRTDSFAASFQSLGQYRKGVIEHAMKLANRKGE